MTRPAAPGGDRGPRTARLGRAGAAAPQDLQALGQDLLEVRHRAALHEHVPVRPGRLRLLRLGLLAVDQAGDGTVELALPDQRDLGVVGERDAERVPLRALVLSRLARGEL